MTRGRARKDVIGRLAALSILACSGCATMGMKSASRPDRLDAPVLAGPMGGHLHEYLSRAARFGFSGTVLVAIDDAPVLHRGYGFADLAREKPNGTHTRYDIGSIVKTLTAAAILLLESEGR